MTTPHPSELLSAYLDDEVTAEERARVETWLDESPEGREELRELDELGEMLRSALATPEGEVDLVAAVQGAVAEPPAARSPERPAAVAVVEGSSAAKRKGGRWTAAVSVAASVAAVLVTALLLSPPNSSVDHEESIARNETDAEFDDELADGSAVGLATEREESVARLERPQAAAAEMAVDLAEVEHEPDSVGDAGTRNRRLYIDGREIAARRDFVVPRGSIPGDVEAGDVIPLYETRAGEVAVVRVTVVDVHRALGEVQVLLQRNDVTPLADEEKTVANDAATVEKLSKESGTYAVYVSASPEQMTAALESLRANKVVVDLEGPRTLVASNDRRFDKPGEPTAVAPVPPLGGPRKFTAGAAASGDSRAAEGKPGDRETDAGIAESRRGRKPTSGSYQLLGPVAAANRAKRAVPTAGERVPEKGVVAEKATDATPKEAARQDLADDVANVRVLLLLERR